MLQGLHILLTYQCLSECDHCFLYCGPQSEGTFTLSQIEAALEQGNEAKITEVYFEGGEPFLYYPLLVEGLRMARARGFHCGIVTNAYWATSERDAALWLSPLIDLGISDLSISDDAFHGEGEERPARIALEVAARLGLPQQSICIESPVAAPEGERQAGEPVVGGGAVLRGRAVEKLAGDVPRHPFACFDACKDEELADPARVHLDPFGNIFVCQGLSIGNIWERSLATILSEYRPTEHPIVGPLLSGGPAELARRFGLPEEDGYASACHLCFLVRKGLLNRFPEYLGPRRVYGEI